MKLLDELILDQAEQRPQATALRRAGIDTCYADLAGQVTAASYGLLGLGLQKGDRVAIYLPKQEEAVIASFAAAKAGGIFVPVNPQLKPSQLAYILRDSGADVLVTTADRATTARESLLAIPNLKLVLTDYTDDKPFPGSFSWQQLLEAPATTAGRRSVDQLAALLYTSGSTGHPKGVMLSHRNIVAGAASVSRYLNNKPEDRLLTVLPFSFDYGFSQLSTAFNVGAAVVLFEYLLPRDVIRAVTKERITGLACVPPVWIQLARLEWPDSCAQHLRFITNSGGSMPGRTLAQLRRSLPATRIFLMYGLTEAFRSTYLDPGELDRRPDSIGKAIPDARLAVLRPNGKACEVDEPGELVHAGPLVAQGYWNDPDRTAVRFRNTVLPGSAEPVPAVWSGDTVRQDKDGFLYFIGRSDDMIKSMGYRVSPTEIEDVAHDSGLVTAAVALGIDHPEQGQAIILVAEAADDQGDSPALLAFCRRRLANYMLPAAIVWRGTLPRTPNGKIDRKALALEYRQHFAGSNA